MEKITEPTNLVVALSLACPNGSILVSEEPCQNMVTVFPDPGTVPDTTLVGEFMPVKNDTVSDPVVAAVVADVKGKLPMTTLPFGVDWLAMVMSKVQKAMPPIF